MDDYTEYSLEKFIKSKEGTASAVKEMVVQIENWYRKQG